VKASPLKEGIDRKAYKVLSFIKRRTPRQMGGALATPTAPQMTDVNPNRWGNLPKGGEEARWVGKGWSH
jgi:hypothetical protein